MSSGPRWLRQQVVDEVDAPDSQQGQGKVQVRKLARPGVSVNEIEFLRRRLFQERRPVHEEKCDPGVVTEVPLRDLNNLGVNVDCHKTGVRIHSREQPRGSYAGAGTEFEKMAVWFGRSEGTK